jgi:23S rRNA pseudouridine2605 synthase
MRLNKFLSLHGYGSRRGAEERVKSGSVYINGEICWDLGRQISIEDQVTVDGQLVERVEKTRVVMLHKPAGYICSKGDTHDRWTIYDLLEQDMQNLHYIGR